MIDKWDRHFMRMALEASSMSKDPSTKVGAVAVKDRRVLATGFNGFPWWMRDLSTRLDERSFKYECIIHAEENLILDAARRGVALDGSSLYVTRPPCFSCFNRVVSAGVTSIFYVDPDPSIRERIRIFDDVLVERMLIDEAVLAGFRITEVREEAVV